MALPAIADWTTRLVVPLNCIDCKGTSAQRGDANLIAKRACKVESVLQSYVLGIDYHPPTDSAAACVLLASGTRFDTGQCRLSSTMHPGRDIAQHIFNQGRSANSFLKSD
mmetsp:Transcript_38645/g.116055  ORF Transcript_38645/g.116055 Transcript_38645/m.116055 type:complete len:110 (-) Transcript_38645:588-917(-)